MLIRPGRPEDFDAILAVVNDGAQAYRGVIPADRWHEPYMPAGELSQEIDAGVLFWVAEDQGRVAGVMGIQDKGEVALVRHAYTPTRLQGKGIGTRLLRHVEGLAGKPVLIGTWADASWAIAFYLRNGYIVVADEDKERLLRRYWSVPDRQIETSVVLADGRWMAAQAGAGCRAMEASFTTTIEVPQSPSVVFERLKAVSRWWGGPDLAGPTAAVGDEFTVIHGDVHYSKQKVIEVVPDSRIVWQVTESRLNWLEEDQSEWTGTRMIFEIAAQDGATRLRFTHAGLTPGKASYARCAEGWALVIGQWLFDCITQDKAHF